MAWQPGDTLNLNANALKALPFIRGAVKAGISKNETERALRRVGLGIRRQTVQSIYSAFEYAYKDSSVYLPTDSRLKPNANLIPYATTQQARKYHATVAVPVYNVTDTLPEVKHVTVIMDDLMSVNDIIDDAVSTVETYDDLESADRHYSEIDSILFTDNPTDTFL